MRQIFILSPAKTSGERARLIYNPRAGFSLARRLQAGGEVPLGEVFSFLSGLYFRGKATYSRMFARPPRRVEGVYVITSNRGLLPLDTPLTLAEIAAFGSVDVDPRNERYVVPLLSDALLLAKSAGSRCRWIFLGSIGTRRYVEPMLKIFGERLLFPIEFVGRGDMSRGGLLLRAAADGRELSYAPLAGAVRHGKRPEKLPPKRWGFRILDGKTELEGQTPRR